MYCRCYRRNSDDEIRKAQREFQAHPDSHEALESWLAKTMRHGQIPVELLIPAIRNLEERAQNTIYDQLRQDPTYRYKPPTSHWDRPDSVEVGHLSDWHPRSMRYTRVNFGPWGESHFHLGPCGRCALPSWGQPCTWCGFYPMGPADYQAQPQTREDFLRRLQRSPNFLHFYAVQNASGRVPQWAPIAARIRDEMIRLGNQYQWPTHEEVWNYHASGGFNQVFPAPPPPPPLPIKREEKEEDGPAYRRNVDSELREAERHLRLNLNDANAWSQLLRQAGRAGQAVYVTATLPRTLKPGRGSIPGALGEDLVATAKVLRIVDLKDGGELFLDVICVDPYFKGLNRGLYLSAITSVRLGH